MKRNYRIGQIVPSSNTTMETEIPALFLARQSLSLANLTPGSLAPRDALAAR